MGSSRLSRTTSNFLQISIYVQAPKKAANWAERSVPGFLSLGQSGIRNAGRGVWAEIPLPKGIAFGPYKGTVVKKRNEAKNSG